jgi:hypothetical protein
MLPILPTPNLNQTLLHLNTEEQSNPVGVLSELCDEYSPGEMRRMFDKMQKIVLLDDHCNHPTIRDIQTYFGELVLKTLEACYLVCLNHTPA